MARVESEETQDDVREALDLSRERAEEIKFRVKRDQHPTERLMFWCDNRCSDKALSFLATYISSGRGW